MPILWGLLARLEGNCDGRPGQLTLPAHHDHHPQGESPPVQRYVCPARAISPDVWLLLNHALRGTAAAEHSDARRRGKGQVPGGSAQDL